MDVFVTRQPIFDRRDEVVAYEILFRQPVAAAGRAVVAGSATSAYSSEGAAADQVVLNAAVGIGLEQLTGTVPAFVPASRELLEGLAFELLDPRRIVVQVRLQDAREPRVQDVLTNLYLAGYHLALVGVPGAAESGLLGLVEYVKLDMAAPPDAALVPAVRAMRERGIHIVAENVPNRGVRDLCLDAGIELFQGYLFSQPETISKRDLSIEHLRTFQLMKRVRDVDVPDHTIEQEFRGDVALAFKLLKIVNSAAVGGRGVRSIAHAMRLLGREPLYRWLGLLLLSSAVDSGVEREIILTALTRARWCELLADAGNRPLNTGSLYIIGLLSLMDRLLGTPMEELLAQMDLAPEVRGALLGRGGPFGRVLALAERYELGEWDSVLELAHDLGISPQEVGRLYLEAIHWAQEHTRSL